MDVPTSSRIRVGAEGGIFRPYVCETKGPHAPVGVCDPCCDQYGSAETGFFSRAEQGKGPVSGFDHSGRRGFAFVRFGAEHLTHDRGEITESRRAVAVESGAEHGG